ncbi:cytochrome c biogenesis protein ResB [Cumulibacter manganitolerans]|uniref:cytochrome c biogenesis protein ResB n=1 Tax=Cumulibacter manganitolerans TaxID=1884992 RepID=UPI001297840A|nr:cytochrome c biogenesis protein ResB [Cumulibacter manganitolerans]
MTTTKDPATDDLLWREDKPVRRPIGASLKELARYWWRQLTSMRTALILLFLLALASVPGSLLPQRNLSPSKVRQYFTEHPGIAPWLSRLGFFNVFSSPWYAAIYLLLFISLIGCLIPRISVYLRAVRAQPPKAPRRLSRFSDHLAGRTDRTVDAVLDDAAALLRKRRWRVVRRDGTLSAEKGYLQEAGNLVFHLSLLALLIALAVGKLNGYEASRIAVEGEGFCNTQMSYDSFTGGPLVDGSDLAPVCIDLKSFDTVYDADLTPARFVSKIDYSTSVGGRTSGATIESNDPLRVDGVRAYVTGHGYAPVFTITLPDGTVRTEQAPFLPVDQKTFASEGALKIDTGNAEKSLALQGFLAPTAQDSSNGIVSTDPRLINPEVALFVYQGYTGLDTGTPQSVYTLDQEVIDSGLLKKVDSVNLKPGASTVLADGTKIQLDSVVEWAAFQVSHDPGQVWVLVSSVVLLVSLMTTLLLRRRRLWVRVVDSGGSRSIEIGGLAHSGQHAFSEEFAAIGPRILGRAQPDDEESP